MEHPKSQLVFNVDTTDNQMDLCTYLVAKLNAIGDKRGSVERREINEDNGDTCTLYVIAHTDEPIMLMSGLSAKQFGIL